MTSSSDLFGSEHVERYRATGGDEGYHWRNDTTILLLTTKGRKSGEERTSPLIFCPWENDYLIVASKGGADEPPAWFLNLQEDPDDVEIQVKADRFKVHPRVASADERPAMWKTMTDAWPDYDNYQESTSREIPIVVLSRA